MILDALLAGIAFAMLYIKWTEIDPPPPKVPELKADFKLWESDL